VKGSSDIWSCGCVLLYLLQDKKERQIPLFDEEDTKIILTSMMQFVGRPSQEDLRRMPTTCKMDKDGIELLNYLADLPEDLKPVVTLKEVKRELVLR
jgi:serine/threonine protein kinase